MFVSLNDCPTFQGAKAHYQTLEAEYSTQVSKLQKLVDSAVDPVQFLGVSEAQIKDDLEEAKAYIKNGEAQKAFEMVASATRKAKRVMGLIEAEMENTNDQQLKQDLQTAKDRIAASELHVLDIVRYSVHCSLAVHVCLYNYCMLSSHL